MSLLGSCIITAIAIVPQCIDAGYRLPKHDPGFILRIIDCVSILLLGVASVLIPRRPAVFRDGREVYAGHTVCVLSSFTWSWAYPLLSLATKKGDLDEKDIPVASHEFRANMLVEKWNEYNFKGKLLYSVLWAYKASFAVQWSVTLIRCCLGLLPFYIMLQLIKMLEKRALGPVPSTNLWFMVIGLGLLNLVENVRVSFLS